MTPEQSIDLLFAQPFEPLWMRRQRQAADQILDDRAETEWRRSAERSRQRIASRSRDGIYSNPPDTRIAIDPPRKRRRLVL